MKTLAIDCRMAAMSGIGVYIRNLVPLCMEKMEGCHFRLLGYNDSFSIPPDISWEAVPFDVPIYSIQEQLFYPKALKGADALWCPHYVIPLLSQIPLAVTVHDLAHLALPSIFGRVKRLYATLVFRTIKHKACSIIAISQFTQSEFLARVGKPRGAISVILNGVSNAWYPDAKGTPLTPNVLPKTPDTLPNASSDISPNASQGVSANALPEISAGPSTAKKKAETYTTVAITHEDHSCTLRPNPFFLALGNIKPHKNIPLLCRAFARIAPKCKANLYVVGGYSSFRTPEIPIEPLEALYPGRIFFCEHLTDQDVRSMMQRASALVFPSCYEGFGLPPLEAMATGIPVIASDIPPVHEVCGPDAYYCNPKSEDDFAKAMLDVLALDSAQRQHIARRNRKRAMLFSWENTATKTVAVLQKLL